MRPIFERTLAGIATWAFFAAVLCAMMILVHFLACFVLWDWIPIAKAVPMLRFAAGIALLPGIFVLIAWKPGTPTGEKR